MWVSSDTCQLQSVFREQEMPQQPEVQRHQRLSEFLGALLPHPVQTGTKTSSTLKVQRWLQLYGGRGGRGVQSSIRLRLKVGVPERSPSPVLFTLTCVLPGWPHLDWAPPPQLFHHTSLLPEHLSTLRLPLLITLRKFCRWKEI